MLRRRRLAGPLLLALMLLGLAAGAGAATAGGDCCAGMTREVPEPGPAAPCHSVAPTSCCEAGATGPLSAAPAALLPIAHAGGLAPAPAPAACALRGGVALLAPAKRLALASVVLRL